LGDDRDFDRLLAVLHGRGLRLVLDGVFNHVARSFPRLLDVVERAEASQYSGWFRRAGDSQDFATFEGHHSLVALNHREPQVVDYVCDVMNHWLRRGVDGFRLDAAYAVPREFWRRVIDRVRGEHPHAWFVGEVIHGDYAGIVAETGFDCVTQYELWKAIWSGLNDANLFELAWALERHDGFVERFVPLTFVGNHDVTRIASRLNDLRHLAHALVVLFTVAGVPAIYAGDEQAFRGVKEERAGGDDAVRPAFPDDPSQLAREGWPIYRLHQALIGVRRRYAWLQNARLSIDARENHVLRYTCHRDDKRLSVVLNIGAAPYALSGRWRRVLASAGEAAQAELIAPPHGWLIFEAA
jgi:cyclomaltodextrinase